MFVVFGGMQFKTEHPSGPLDQGRTAEFLPSSLILLLPIRSKSRPRRTRLRECSKLLQQGRMSTMSQRPCILPSRIRMMPMPCTVACLPSYMSSELLRRKSCSLRCELRNCSTIRRCAANQGKASAATSVAGFQLVA